MADYLFNYAAGPLEYGSAPLSEQVQALLRARIWGLTDRTPYRKRIAPGDRMIAYVGGDEQAFVGSAVLASSYRPFTADERARHPGSLQVGVLLDECDYWDSPVPRTRVWSRLTLARRWPQGGIMALGEGDFERIVPPAPGARSDRSRPFDPSRGPAAYGDVSAPDAVAAAALAEKAAQDHFDLLVVLDAHLRSQGWTDSFEIPGSIDLWARDPAGQRHIFEVKTLRDELSATRAATAQLLEYRVVHGDPGDRICLVVGAPLSKRRAQILKALGIDVLTLRT